MGKTRDKTRTLKHGRSVLTKQSSLADELVLSSLEVYRNSNLKVDRKSKEV